MPDFTPRPTIYKGIKMRSRLEAGFAGWLDRSNLSWKYEPFAVGDEHGQYLPDFVITDGMIDPQTGQLEDAVIEVKPTASVIDFDRLTRAAGQLRASGRPPILILAIADQGTFVVTDAAKVESVANLLPMVWVFVERDGRDSVAVALAPLEVPFSKDWWR